MNDNSTQAVSFAGQFATSLRELRLARDISQRELARRAGVSPDTVSQLERASALPTLDTLLRLQVGLRLPSLELLLAGQTAFTSSVLGNSLVANLAPDEGG